MPQPVGGLEGELIAHPFITLVLISTLAALLTALVRIGISRTETRINERFSALEKRDDTQDERLEMIEKDLKDYEQNVAVGRKESEEIHAALDRIAELVHTHTQKEETQTWGKFDSLSEMLAQMSIANEKAHGAIVERLARVEVLIADVRKA